MAERNFLLGYGERLTGAVPLPPRDMRETVVPYDFESALARLGPMLNATAQALGDLPDELCPGGEAVASVTLHPQFLAKSYFPAALLRSAELRAVGSRQKRVTPERGKRGNDPVEDEATEIFVAGSKTSFTAWAEGMGTWDLADSVAQEFTRLEDVHAPTVAERVKRLDPDNPEPMLEVVLHAGEGAQGAYILDAFEGFLGSSFDLALDADRRFFVGGLCFVPLRAPRDAVSEIARFSFLRAIRPMPKIRGLEPMIRSIGPVKPFPVQLPDVDAVAPGIRVAVFDGGMPSTGALDRWVEALDAPGIGAVHEGGPAHGGQVTSSLLFGALTKGEGLPRPYANVDHWRVIDDASGGDADAYDVLDRICRVLETSNYQFVNLSLGPEIPIEDDDIHGWTARLDELLADGSVLTAVAAGNGGEDDPALGFNRVQVPADCVNAIAIGAADRRTADWERADYSSVGFGRSPGRVKPDVLAFGGSDKELLWVADAEAPGFSVFTAGTSFSSPIALRLATGVRAHFGDHISPLATRALLVHAAHAEAHDRADVGWGRIPEDLESLVVCPDGMVRVVYQGKIAPKRAIRAPIPVPDDPLPGNVTIRATFCYATKTDAAFPGAYTRAGLAVTFRPHDQRMGTYKDEKGVTRQSTMPATAPFFQKSDFDPEKELRHDAHKWETTLHKEITKRGSGLRNPAFDVHYVAREEGGDGAPDDELDYALVVTVSSKRVQDLYNRVVTRYRTVLRPLVPAVQIPIRT